MKESFLGSFAKKFARDAGIDEQELGSVTSLLETVSQKIDNKAETPKTKMISQNPQNNHLWFSQYESNQYFLRTSFNYNFYDDNGTLKYYAIGDKNNKLQKIKLYDSNKRLLGEIHEKRDLLKSPIELRSHYNFDAIIRNKKVGQIKVTVSPIAKKISFNNDEWYTVLKQSLKNQLTLPCYQILSRNGMLVAETTERMDSTFLDFPYGTDEIKLMLFMLAEHAVYIIKSRKDGKYK